jgi:tetratricopeptide (TPR) repeat protein
MSRTENRLTSPKTWSGLLAILLVSHSCLGDARLENSWALPSFPESRQRFFEWLQTQPIEEGIRQTALDEFSEHAGGSVERLTALIDALATFNDRARVLKEALESHTPLVSAHETAWLESVESDQFDVRHLRLYYASALNESRRYDEALRWLQGIESADVICPDVLLFQRAIAHHQLVQSDEALNAIGELLRCKSTLPIRYTRLAAMMQADLEPLEMDSLDHIGRRMNDVERRLQIGKANESTTKVEDAIIASLDKLIKEAEEQQQQMQQQQSAQGSPPPSGKPMEESRIAELKGPGKVDPRKLSEDTQWGRLEPHERERIMQQLGRDFPSHYREVVEEYFRQLAREKQESSEQP